MAESLEQKPTKTEAKSSDKTGLWIGFFVGLVLLAISALSAHTHQLNGWQLSVFRFFDNWNLSSFFTTLAKFVTEALGSGYPIALCVIIPLFFKKYRLSWRFFFTVGGALAAATVVKYLVNEPRPIVMLSGHLHQRVVETGPGFPSNHVAAATALALTLWFILPVKWRWLSVLWILIVAWSRLYLGVHTPADVVAGFAVGLMAVCFVRLLPPSIAKPLRLDD